MKLKRGLTDKDYVEGELKFIMDACKLRRKYDVEIHSDSKRTVIKVGSKQNGESENEINKA